ncbi:hypothetical protein N7E02_07440 (plasmid) [Aliirhizobium terrae]|uniref:hypothetical protein n=1 Tax=Terrirhizobium terrae TaxID=2926709 RepID=UPI002575BEB3|nr:hypothetical protein [Rhizobium sp. CC-CFT758]WJH38446.1 hypothetical protein N7E02_07440 [Rhizobium sp. CC-CFT758]
MEALEQARGQIEASVTSDYFGGVEIVGASFLAAMMAIDQNLKADLLTEMKDRTKSGRAELKARFDHAFDSLGRASTR